MAGFRISRAGACAVGIVLLVAAGACGSSPPRRVTASGSATAGTAKVPSTTMTLSSDEPVEAPPTTVASDLALSATSTTRITRIRPSTASTASTTSTTAITPPTTAAEFAPTIQEPTTTTAPPVSSLRSCTRDDVAAELTITPGRAKVGEPVTFTLRGTNRAATPCLLRIEPDWPRFSFDVAIDPRPSGSDPWWQYGFCADPGGGFKNDHLASGPDEVAWQPGETRTVSRVWDQRLCLPSATTAPAGHYVSSFSYFGMSERGLAAVAPRVAFDISE